MDTPNDVTVTPSGGKQLQGNLRSFLRLLKLLFKQKKSKAHNEDTKCHTMLVQDSFLGSLLVLPVVLWKENCWMKQQSNKQKQGHLQLSKLAVWVLWMGHRA